MSLPKIQLTKIGQTVSRFGLGGFHQLEITSDIVAEVVEAFLAEGGNYIETARGYGNGASETKIGKAIAGRRNELVLASKTGATTADEARRDLEKSLKCLNTDYLDVYFFHGVAPDKLEKITAPGGAVEGFIKAKEEGLIKGLGLSSHVPSVYLDAMEQIDLAVILVWVNYLDCLNWPIIPEQIIPKARELGVGITGMKPLADGLLWQSVSPAVRYAMGIGAEVVVSGTNSPEQVAQMAAAVREKPADESSQKEILRYAPELGTYVCRSCGQCSQQIMDLFQLEGEADRQMIDQQPHDPANLALRQKLSGWFGQAEHARQKFTEAGHDINALLTAADEIKCPYNIDIPRKIKLAAAKLADQEINTL